MRANVTLCVIYVLGTLHRAAAFTVAMAQTTQKIDSQARVNRRSEGLNKESTEALHLVGPYLDVEPQPTTELGHLQLVCPDVDRTLQHTLENGSTDVRLSEIHLRRKNTHYQHLLG